MDMKDFIYLKRTYPISLYERECDAYKYLIENTTEEQRKEWGIKTENLKNTIQENEKYMYQVGKEMGVFKVVSCSIENFTLVRKYIFGIKDEN